MILIQKLLSRIKWDKEFGTGFFEIGYYDRIEEKIIRIPFADIIFPRDRRDAIQVMDAEGIIHSVPLHRIREVYKDGELIWQRTTSVEWSAK